MSDYNMNVLNRKEEEKLFSKINDQEIIDIQVKISNDGSNYLVRIPKDIVNFFEINEKNRTDKRFRFFIEENKDHSLTKKFDIVDVKNGKKNKEKTED